MDTSYAAWGLSEPCLVSQVGCFIHRPAHGPICHLVACHLLDRPYWHEVRTVWNNACITIVLHSLWIKSQRIQTWRRIKYTKELPLTLACFLILNIKRITLDTVSLAGVARHLPQDTGYYYTSHGHISHSIPFMLDPLSLAGSAVLVVVSTRKATSATNMVQ